MTLPIRYGTLRAEISSARLLSNPKKFNPIDGMGRSTPGAFYDVKRRFATDVVGKNDRREFSAREA
ncbi:MAG: hypothetical protein WBM17_10150 [Anaerolineales bacterium]